MTHNPIRSLFIKGFLNSFTHKRIKRNDILAFMKTYEKEPNSGKIIVNLFSTFTIFTYNYYTDTKEQSGLA